VPGENEQLNSVNANANNDEFMLRSA